MAGPGDSVTGLLPPRSRSFGTSGNENAYLQPQNPNSVGHQVRGLSFC